MVERTRAQTFTEFIGTVQEIKKVRDSQREGGEQYHIEMKPLDVEIGGKTGLMHEWVRITDTTTETSVPEGSVIDRYLQELEDCIPETKKQPTVDGSMKLMVGKSFRFKRKKLGRSFQGQEAKEYWTPSRLISSEEASKIVKKPKK